jgi:hypothetical protein
MIIQSDFLHRELARKAHSHAQDRSRHLLCPACRVRTRLYALKDGRRKCSACGEKFNPAKKTDAVRLKQCADILLCFCINFTAQQASTLSGHRYRLVAALYDAFRLLLATQTSSPEELRSLAEAHAYGMRVGEDKRVRIEPLGAAAGADYAAFAGYVSDGKFHRFSGNERAKDGAEQLWAWMNERLRRHHGIWKRNLGLYLKELEWKYNNRRLAPEEQAIRIVELMPDGFLSSWSDRRT